MKIIVCGAGRVGFSISRQLSAQDHSITVVDQSSELIQKINKLTINDYEPLWIFDEEKLEDQNIFKHFIPQSIHYIIKNKPTKQNRTLLY